MIRSTNVLFGSGRDVHSQEMQSDSQTLQGIAPTAPGHPSGELYRGTRAKAVADRLRDMIAQNELPPGARIRERAIGELLQVSRTPMREALRILAAERLVELLPNRGAVVRAPSPREIQDLLSVLASLEALAGEQASANARDDEITEVRALHFEMLAAYERKDRLTYFKLNQGIHRAIVAASHNAALVELHAMTNARLYRVRYQCNLNSANWHNAIEEHEAILAALCARDGQALAEILRQHLGHTWVKVSEMLRLKPDT